LTTKQNDISARISATQGSSCAPYALLIVAVLLAYANVYLNAFVFDDILLIVQNTFLRSWSNLQDILTKPNLTGAGFPGGFYRPVLMLVYFLIYQLFGLSTSAFHAVNVVLHTANACLVYRLGRKLNFNPSASLGAALIWGLHPIHTEAVTYISALGELLYSFFCLLGLVVVLPDCAPRKLWLSGLLFVLALGSKESAVVFPALVVICICLTTNDRLRLSPYVRTWPLWLIGAAYMAGWLAFIHASGYNLHDQSPDYLRLYANNLTNRILTFLATLPVYIGMLIWPTGLHLDRTFAVFTTLWSWRVMAGAAMVVGVILQILWGRGRRGLALSWGFLWFAAAYSPSSGIIIPSDMLIAERWMYLPTIGIALGTAGSLSSWLELKPRNVWIMAICLAAVIAISLGMKTQAQNRLWHDSGTLYKNILSYEESGLSHNNLGLFYAEHGEFEKAIDQFRTVILHPDMLPQSEMAMVHVNLAVAYLRAMPDETGTVTLQTINQALRLSSRSPEAIAELKTALDLNPTLYGADNILGMIYAYQGDNEKASFYGAQAASALDKTAP
jgi:Tfp pilus assembly protein PilF